ncbi:hypothetical protein GCM10027054_22200 [Isoptericola nanjingensis]
MASSADDSAAEGRESSRLRRRQSRKLQDLETGISDEVARAYELVPAIGKGRRWYDIPYRALSWLSSGWRRRILPRRALLALNYGINYLIPYNEHDRDFVRSRDSWMHNVFVPEDYHVTSAGIWVIELFPPSQLPAFEAALVKNGWKRPKRWAPAKEDNPSMLQRARSGRGAIWWPVVDVVRKGSKWWVPDGIRADLPPHYEWIGLRAMQVGAGLTAVIARFTLTELAASSLDSEWHRDHEPILIRGSRGERPRNLDRHWATFQNTQSARKSLHDSAREWMKEQVPGFFAASNTPQLLLDLLLLEGHDPTLEPYVETAREDEIKRSDALRALGLPDRESHHIVSTSLKKLVLSPPDPVMHPGLGDGPTWTLWGNRDAIIEAWGNDAFAGFSDSTNRGIAYRVESTYPLLTMLAVSNFLEIGAQRYAEIRDRATTRHGKFRPGALRELRQFFLTLSLDLTTVRREAASFWENDRYWRWEAGDDFVFQPTPSTLARYGQGERYEKESRNFNMSVRKRQDEQFELLIAADRDYRDILSTVASIGASVDAFKIGRWALWVALASLAVAVATIILADVGCDSVIHQFVGWPSSETCEQ